MVLLVDRDRLVNRFLELVRIDSVSLKERAMADHLKKVLQDMGLKVCEDNAGEKIGGEAGNLIATLKGEAGITPIFFEAHMDTVEPGIGKKPVIKDDRITSDGTTILGGDDAAGIAAVLEAVQTVLDNGLSHGDVQIVFTVGEEIGILGAKNLDYSKVYAKYGFVFDGGGRVGTVDVKAPSQYSINVVVHGKAAHAGVEPEKGVSAIRIAADAISRMKLGRIDPETTANVGVITGGRATNIITDRVDIKAEARSRNERKLEEQVEHMRGCFEESAARFGGSCEFSKKLEYPAFDIPEDAGIISILRNAAQDAGIELALEPTGGGSDTNIFNGRGIPTVNLGVGMYNVHTTSEYVEIDSLVKTVEFILAIIKHTK